MSSTPYRCEQGGAGRAAVRFRVELDGAASGDGHSGAGAAEEAAADKKA